MEGGGNTPQTNINDGGPEGSTKLCVRLGWVCHITQTKTLVLETVKNSSRSTKHARETKGEASQGSKAAAKGGGFRKGGASALTGV